MTPKQIKALFPKKRKEKDVLMTRKELAKHFKVSPDAIDHYAKKKDIPVIREARDTKNGGGVQVVNLHNLSAFSAWKPMRYKNSEWHQQ